MVKAYQIEKPIYFTSHKTVSHFASHCKILELWVLEAWYGINLQRTKPLQEGSFNFLYLLHKIQSAIQFKETIVIDNTLNKAYPFVIPLQFRVV
jgi:hypothetical protein